MIPKALLYRDQLIAFLSDSQMEWPRSSSIYKLNSGVNGELVDYIQSSIEYSILVRDNDEEAMRIHNAKVEIKFTPLINSDQWFVLDQDDKKNKILAPIFHPEKIMVWMLK